MMEQRVASVTSDEQSPLRLRRVFGFKGRVNDTLFHPATVRVAPQQLLVYFGGDIQDYPEIMEAHHENCKYVKWNLENVAKMLRNNFPTKHILIVRPSRIEYKSFSCYDNFVPSNNAGVPEHTPTHNALQHLERLIKSVGERLKDVSSPSPPALPEESQPEQSNKYSCSSPDGASTSRADRAGSLGDARTAPSESPVSWDKLSLEGSRVTLVGFSKGCVVLNQMLYEFHYTSTLTPSDSKALRFINRIEAMYWLDGGHAGGKNTWITARGLLETLSRLDMTIYVHVSPYQVRDESRPWIGREEKAFSTLLKTFRARIHRYMHGRSKSPHSLDMHFEVLANFKQVQDLDPRQQDSSDEEI